MSSTVTSQKIRNGVHLITWVNQRYQIISTKVTVAVAEGESSQLCQLSYKIESGTTNFELEFLPESLLVNDKKFLEPTSVLAIKYGTSLPMKLENSKWTTKFSTAHVCCGRTGLIFDVLIDFNPKNMTLMKTESKHVIEHLFNLWETKTLYDVIFKFKEKDVKAHTLILASGSPVLAAMFQHDFKEKQDRVVEIKDVKPPVFEKLLRFIYTGDADLENVDVSELLVVADKYGVDSLKEECALRLAQDLNVDNATKYLVLSHLHNSSNLYESTLDFMSLNAKAICSRKEWMEVIKSYPELSFAAMQIMVMGC